MAKEMLAGSQLLQDLTEQGVPIKLVAAWTGMHENTVRAYISGGIKGFGSEIRFWNAVFIGLCCDDDYCDLALPIFEALTQNTSFQIINFGEDRKEPPTLSEAIKQFIPINKNLVGAMESTVAIIEDGKVDGDDDPNIAELVANINRSVSLLLGIKHFVLKERTRVTR